MTTLSSLPVALLLLTTTLTSPALADDGFAQPPPPRPFPESPNQRSHRSALSFSCALRGIVITQIAAS